MPNCSRAICEPSAFLKRFAVSTGRFPVDYALERRIPSRISSGKSKFIREKREKTREKTRKLGFRRNFESLGRQCTKQYAFICETCVERSTTRENCAPQYIADDCSAPEQATGGSDLKITIRFPLRASAQQIHASAPTNPPVGKPT